FPVAVLKLNAFHVMEQDALTQVEGVNETVFRHFPAFGQSRYRLTAYRVEANQPFIDLLENRADGDGGSGKGVEMLRIGAHWHPEHGGLVLRARRNCDD